METVAFLNRTTKRERAFATTGIKSSRFVDQDATHAARVLEDVQGSPPDIRWTIHKDQLTSLSLSRRPLLRDRTASLQCFPHCRTDWLWHSLQRITRWSSTAAKFHQTSPPTPRTDPEGRIVRPPSALRPLTSCKWFWILCSIHWTSVTSTRNDSSKSHGYHIQTAKVRRTSSWCSISLYPGKNGRCSKIIWNFPNRNVQTFGFVYHDTNGQNHGPVWKIQSFLLSETCTVILWQECYGKGNLRKSYWITVGRKFQIGNDCSYTVKKDYSYLCMWMT